MVGRERWLCLRCSVLWSGTNECWYCGRKGVLAYKALDKPRSRRDLDDD